MTIVQAMKRVLKHINNKRDCDLITIDVLTLKTLVQALYMCSLDIGEENSIKEDE